MYRLTLPNSQLLIRQELVRVKGCVLIWASGSFLYLIIIITIPLLINHLSPFIVPALPQSKQ
jgi:hypothetical protein